MGPDSRSDNSKTAHFLHKYAQNRQKGVICVRAESIIRVKAPRAAPLTVRDDPGLYGYLQDAIHTVACLV